MIHAVPQLTKDHNLEDAEKNLLLALAEKDPKIEALVAAVDTVVDAALQPKDTNLEALIAAAETVVNRWDSPNWIRGEPHTGALILNLRKACDAVKQNAR